MSDAKKPVGGRDFDLFERLMPITRSCDPRMAQVNQIIEAWRTERREPISVAGKYEVPSDIFNDMFGKLP